MITKKINVFTKTFFLDFPCFPKKKKRGNKEKLAKKMPWVLYKTTLPLLLMLVVCMSLYTSETLNM